MQAWFDGHIDLACLTVMGRDMLGPVESATKPWPPGAVTIPSLRDGGVSACLGTIFTEVDGDGAVGYPAGDVDAAFKRGRAQLEVYLTWQDAGHVGLKLPGPFRRDEGVGEVRGGMGASEVVAKDPSERIARSPKMGLGVLMENADPIRSPDDLAWWVERGVVAIGMSWWRSSRYAGGNGTDDPLTEAGRDLAAAMDEQFVTHDLSHLSQRATDQMLEATDAPVIASHSNCRALMDGKDQRHLADETIVEIGRRGGVVGVALVSNFLREGLSRERGDRASIDDVVAHVERICELMGRRTGVAIGSDMDGGFSREGLPAGIDAPRDLERIADALEQRGWSRDDLDGFRFNNWALFFASQRKRMKPSLSPAPGA